MTDLKPPTTRGRGPAKPGFRGTHGGRRRGRFPRPPHASPTPRERSHRRTDTAASRGPTPERAPPGEGDGGRETRERPASLATTEARPRRGPGQPSRARAARRRSRNRGKSGTAPRRGGGRRQPDGVSRREAGVPRHSREPIPPRPGPHRVSSPRHTRRHRTADPRGTATPPRRPLPPLEAALLSLSSTHTPAAAAAATATDAVAPRTPPATRPVDPRLPRKNRPARRAGGSGAAERSRGNRRDGRTVGARAGNDDDRRRRHTAHTRLTLGRRRARAGPCELTPSRAIPNGATEGARLIVKRRSDRRSPGRNPGPQVRSKCR